MDISLTVFQSLNPNPDTYNLKERFIWGHNFRPCSAGSKAVNSMAEGHGGEKDLHSMASRKHRGKGIGDKRLEYILQATLPVTHLQLDPPAISTCSY